MVFEYRVGWNSGGTNPGVTVFHGRKGPTSTDSGAAEDLRDKARAFFDAVKGMVGGGVVWNFPGEVTELDTVTGQLQNVVQITAGASVTATGATAYAAPAGGRIEWRTPAIVNGRRLRGRTYVVPLTTGFFDTQGTLSASAITTLSTAAAAFLDLGTYGRISPCVWSRTHGVLADITSAIVPDEAAVMRSRRE